MTVTVEFTEDAHVGSIRGVPYYANGTAPGYLQSLTALRERRLKPGPGQQPAAYVRTRYYKTLVGLYDPAGCVELPARRVGDEWAYWDRRTCPLCRERRGYVINDAMCGKCRASERGKAARLYKRTCRKCGKVGRHPYAIDKQYPGWHRCPPCRVERAAELRTEFREGLERTQHCPDCGKTVMTRNAALAAHRTYGYWVRRVCGSCEAKRVRQREIAAQEAREAEQRAIQARRDQVASLEQWARDMLADPDVVILDTETTGLHDTARIVEIAITTTTGETLLDTLVNPGEPIPAQASDIHGITDAMVAGAPTFADILPDLAAAIRRKRVLIYNVDYDTARIQHELEIHLGGAHPGQRIFDATAIESAARWMTCAAWEDVLQPYAEWVGEWSEWHGNYRWQRLGGGHRALGDCRAVIDVLKAMAKGSTIEEETW